MNAAKLVTRDGLPSRYAVEGFKTLCCDQDGFDRIEAVKKKYIGVEQNTPSVRRELRLELLDLFRVLKHQGHLFRKDGAPLT